MSSVTFPIEPDQLMSEVIASCFLSFKEFDGNGRSLVVSVISFHFDREIKD